MAGQLRRACHQSAHEAVECLGGDLNHGLRVSHVSSRRREVGWNRLPEAPEEPIWRRLVDQFSDPLILLLLASAGLSVLMGHLEDAISITLAVAIVGAVAFYQETQSAKSLAAIETLLTPTAVALRDSEWVQISAEELVPGDVIKLTTGDRVPADCRLISASGLTIDEASLTGETDPQFKTTEALFSSSSVGSLTTTDTEGCEPHTYNNAAFTATLVSSGTATAVVVTTGGDTEFGRTVAAMAAVEEKRTPLQEAMDRLGQRLSFFSLIIIGAITFVGVVFYGYDWVEMITIGVSLAVAAIPEGLPICVTVTLALGVMRMASSGAVVKTLPAVEALGCASVVCTDKTGTLTEGKMVSVAMYSPVFDEPVLLIPPVGDTTRYLPESGASDPLMSSVSSYERAALAAEMSGDNAQISSSLVYYKGLETVVDRFPFIDQLLHASVRCNNATLSTDGKTANGQPTEVALLQAAKKLGVADDRSDVTRVREIPFSSDLKFMEVVYNEMSTSKSTSSVNEWPSETPSRNERTRRYLKGALEVILPQCSSFVGSKGEVLPLTATETKRLIDAADEMSADGLRVIALATGYSTGVDGLTIVGLVALMDRIRAGVGEAVRRIQDSGARVVMITGDALLTAVSIARSVGIFDGVSPAAIAAITGANTNSQWSTTASGYISNSSWEKPSGTMGGVNSDDEVPIVMSGRQLEELVQSGDKDLLIRRLASVRVFYRTAPRHKLWIVTTHQSTGAIVAMTGDGANDAAALKAADIGVAMGSGSAVAHEAASVVVTDDNFSTLVSAIEEGKAIFFNIKAFLSFQLSTAVAALALVAVAAVAGRPSPLNAMQILFINIVMDGPLAQSLGVEAVDEAVRRRPPRKREDDILTPQLLRRVFTSGIWILLGTLWVAFGGLFGGLDSDVVSSPGESVAAAAASASDVAGTEPSPRLMSLTFTAFVLFDVVNAYTCRHQTASVFSLSPMGNNPFALSAIAVLLGQAAILYFPPLQSIFRTEPLSLFDLFALLMLSITLVILDTIRKSWFPSVFAELPPPLRGSGGSHSSAKYGRKNENLAFSV